MAQTLLSVPEPDVPARAKALIGTKKVLSYDVTLKDIKRFAQAIGDSDPLFHDEAYASGTRHGGIVAPELFFQAITYDDLPVDELPPDGSPIGIDIPLDAERTVGGASDFRIYGRVRPGDTITVQTTLKDIYAKQGRSGKLYFIEVETTFTNQNQQTLAVEVASFIRR